MLADPVVEQALAGNQDAYTALWQSHRAVVERAVKKIAGDDLGIAEDLTQETFAYAFTHLHQFRRESAFATWLVTIAHSCARMHNRKLRARIKTVALDDLDHQAVR